MLAKFDSSYITKYTWLLLSFIVRLRHDILSVTGNKPQLCVQFQQYLPMMPEETTC